MVYDMRVANTQDHRQNRTHTYKALIIDKSQVEGKKFLELEVPDSEKGLAIGRGGSNIKRVAEELGVKYIKVK